DGEEIWRTSPGGLVAALEPMMRSVDGAWAGWASMPDAELAPFDADGIRLIPVSLSEHDVEENYEGFSNDTIWPLYHDVIAPPQYQRVWWDGHASVNLRFAAAAADAVAENGSVWVHDYQLQLVPEMVRNLRPDITIGSFHHIPFPSHGLYAQLPWRDQVLRGLLGADVVGFQRTQDASYFLAAVRRRLKYDVKSTTVNVPDENGPRTVIAKAFPISIDTAPYLELIAKPEVQARA